MKLDHLNIVTENMERAIAFYRDLLGFRVTFETTLHGDWIEQVSGLNAVSARCVFLELASGEVRLELLEYQSPRGASHEENRLANTRGLRHFALQTDDMDALCEKLRAADIAFVSPPVEVPFLVGEAKLRKRLCYFHDPDGVLLELAEYSHPES